MNIDKIDEVNINASNASNALNFLNLYNCEHCHNTINLPKTVDKTNFKYYTCYYCNHIVQVNPYKIKNINSSILQNLPIETIKTSKTAKIATVKITKENIKLDEVVNQSIIEHFPYISELYNIGDELVVSDILHKHKLVSFDNQRDMFKLFFIKHDLINMGIIGMETYSCDPNNAWLAWTTIIPRFRHKGYGKIAFNLLFNRLILENKKYLYIDSVVNENTIKFYNTLGFEAIGNCKNFRKDNKGYNKEILPYNKNIVFRMDIEKYKSN